MQIESKKVTRVKGINSKFAKEILDDFRVTANTGLLRCIQCGMCSSSCPAAKFTDFSPREIINSIFQSKKEELLQNKSIWNCFSCYTCHMRCPRNNSPITIIQVLKQKAINAGYNLDQIKPFLVYGESFVDFGMGALSNEFFSQLAQDWGEKWLEIRFKNDETREYLGLPSMFLPEESQEQIKKILELSGFVERLKKIRGTYDEKTDPNK